uniref:RRP12-like protein n=1 Tax=Megaselia scalaris TaxID=36166 RepID=T1GUQ5_MEGSC
MEDDSSSDDEDMLVVKKKKGSESVKSGMTSGSKYVAGGKGIHRNLGASSVKSGYSGISRMSTATAKSVGSVYKSKKAQGDMKKKGKLDPYAYIPLSRNILNKRKRSKNVGQFKSLVSGKAKKNTSKGKKM